MKDQRGNNYALVCFKDAKVFCYLSATSKREDVYAKQLVMLYATCVVQREAEKTLVVYWAVA